MKNVKKFIALLICIIIMSTFFASCNQGGTTETSTSQNNESTVGTESQPEGQTTAYFPLKDKAKITLFGYGFWFPIDKMLVMKDLQAKLNVEIAFNCPADWEGYTDKKNIALATKNISDVMEVPMDDAKKFGAMGAFVDLGKYLDKLPNVKKRLDEYPDYKYYYTTASGSIYGLPKISNGFDAGTALFMYNKDKFAELGINPAKNLDELYQVAKTIKEKLPDSYPIVGRTNSGEFNTILQAIMNSMGIGWDTEINFFKNENMYKFTPLDAKFKDAVLFMKKLYDEKLVDTAYATYDWGKMGKAFQNDEDGDNDPVNNLKSFILADSLSTPQIYMMNRQNAIQMNIAKGLSTDGVTNTSNSPDYNLSANTTNDAPMWMDGNISINWTPVGSDDFKTGLCIDAKAEKDPQKLELLLNFVDWLYSDEAWLLFNYGREGVFYTMVDGKPVVTNTSKSGTQEYAKNEIIWRTELKGIQTPDMTEDQVLMQYNNYGTYPWTALFQINDRLGGELGRYGSLDITPEIIGKMQEYIKTSTILGKRPVPMTDEDLKKVITLATQCKDFTLAEVDKFIMGKKPMEEWDAFINELKAKGASELEVIYNTAYNYETTK